MCRNDACFGKTPISSTLNSALSVTRMLLKDKLAHPYRLGSSSSYLLFILVMCFLTLSSLEGQLLSPPDLTWWNICLIKPLPCCNPARQVAEESQALWRTGLSSPRILRSLKAHRIHLAHDLELSQLQAAAPEADVACETSGDREPRARIPVSVPSSPLLQRCPASP